MRTNIIVVDDFYGNPDSVRAFALQQEFNVTGNYPGTRSKSFLNDDVKQTIQSILWNAAGEVTNWNATDGFTGSFQITTASDRSWIHSDHYNTWAGVCYLTPNAPHTGGTGLFRHKASGARLASQLESYEAQDVTKWDLIDTIGNQYNRIVFYRSDMFHMSLDYFGHNNETGRLFQLFFLTTQF